MPTPVIELPESLPSVPSKRTKKGRKLQSRRAVASAIREGAISEVQRIQSLPCLNWTWGVSMDASDIPALRCSSDTGNILPHLGYDESLTHGTESRTLSKGTHNVDNIEEGYFSNVSIKVLRPIPPCYYHHSSHFLPDLQYKSKEPIPSSGTADVPCSLTHAPLPPFPKHHWENSILISFFYYSFSLR